MKKTLQVIMMAVLLVFVASASFAEDPIVLKIGMTTEIEGIITAEPFISRSK